MRFNSIAFLAGVTMSGGGGGSVPVMNGSSRAGPSSFVNNIVITPPAGMQPNDSLVLVGFWDQNYSSSNIGTFYERTPASWSGAPSVRRLIISEPFTSVPGSVTLTFAGSGIYEFAVYAVPNILTSAVVASGVGTTGNAVGARNHSYTTTLPNSLVVGFFDFDGGTITGADTTDSDHNWVLNSGSGYNHSFGGVRETSGSYNASVAPIGGSSGSGYGWVEIGAA